MNIQTEIELHVVRIERETFRPSFHGLIIKFQALKSAICDLFECRKEAYEQLMLAEIALSEAEPSPQAARALDCIANAKGLLACTMLGLIAWSICDPFTDLERARGRTRGKGRGREECILSDFMEPEEVIA